MGVHRVLVILSGVGGPIIAAPITFPTGYRVRIVLCFPVEPHHVEQIQQAAPDAEVINAGQKGVATELLQADIFCGHAKVPVDWEAVVSEGRLRWIQSSAAGMDHCLVPPVIESDIVVSSASGLFANQVAEQTMALLFGFIRSMPIFYAAQQKHEFVRRPTGELRGKRIGIVGFGGNGRRIAEVLAPYRCQIVATDMFPHDKPDYVDKLWPADQLDRLLRCVDIAILCIPLNDQTRSLIDAKCLGQMSAGSLLVNMARGQVVNEEDLIESLQSGHLGGAALDVTQTEPLPTDSPLWDMQNVIITPHVGAQSARRVGDTVDFFCQNFGRFQRGYAPLNLVDKRLGFPVPGSE